MRPTRWRVDGGWYLGSGERLLRLAAASSLILGGKKKNQQCGLVGGRWLRLRFLAEMAPTVSPADTCLCLVLEDIGGDVCWGLERAGGGGSGRSDNTRKSEAGRARTYFSLPLSSLWKSVSPGPKKCLKCSCHSLLC